MKISKGCRLSYLLGVLYFLVACLLSLFVTLHADSVSPRVELTSVQGVDDMINLANDYSNSTYNFNIFEKKIVNSIGRTSYLLLFNIVEYNKLTSVSDKKDLVSYTLECIDNSGISSTDKTKVYNFLSEQDSSMSSIIRQFSSDVNTDFATAYYLLRYFLAFISVALGVVSLVLFIGMTFTFILDLTYLTIPLAHIIMQGKLTTKPPLVSFEAYKAYNDVESSGTSSRGNYLLAYAFSKGKQFIIVSVCVLYLTLGEIFNLFGWAIDLFIGFTGLFS